MKLITIVYNDAALLPHFLWHYSALGIKQFLIGVYEEPALSETIRKVAKGYDVQLTSIPGIFDGNKDWELRQSLCRRYVGEEEWWAVTDLDEFHQYPGPLAQVCEQLERSGYRYLQSEFLDRVTADGHPPALRDDIGLWEQFPAAAYITRDLQKTIATKLMLIRGHSPFCPGHHAPAKRATGRAMRAGIVHHFKWFGEVRGKTQTRQTEFARTNTRPCIKTVNLLQFWEAKGRLPIAGEFGFHFPVKPKDWPDFTRPDWEAD